MKVSTVAEMRTLDQTAIQHYGIPGELLMENAALAVYSALQREIEIAAQRFLVICGGGNNGADGLALARKLHSAAASVEVLLLSDPQQYTAAAQMNYAITARLPISVRRIESVSQLEEPLRACDVVVDAIFGTGLARPVQDVYQQVIEAINASAKPVVSVDIPSGVNGDTGKVMGAAVNAAITVTFGLPKLGNLLYPGYALSGKLYVSHISFPPEMYAALTIETNCPPPLPPRKADGHKGDFGDALFIAGCASYLGAPYFSALSFMKAGGGYARLAAPRSITPFIAVKGSEIVFLPQAESGAGSLALSCKPTLLDLAEKVDFVVLGPGISLHPETQELARQLTAELHKPLLLDGDGITALCENPDILRQRQAPTVLTPHLAEMARLTKSSTAAIDADKLSALRRACTDLNAAIVLKGAHSLIGFPDGSVFVNLSGNSGMATAGSGDTLTGAIAAMYGLGLPFAQAVQKGVFLHGLAGDLAASDLGEDGVTASDILDHLPAALQRERLGTAPCAPLIEI